MPQWLFPESQPVSVPPALLSGFAVYTTFCMPIGPRWFQAHLQRLQRDAETIGLNVGCLDGELYDWLVQRVSPEEPVVRLTLYPDVAAYNALFQRSPLPAQLLISSRPKPLPAKPLSLQAIRYSRPLPTIKLAGMGEIVHFKRQALQAGYDELLLVNAQGQLAEASTANFFAWDVDGVLQTPEPIRDGCLPGITRAQVLELAAALQIPVQTSKPLALSDCTTWRGAFLTNAIQGLVPVQRIEQAELPWPEAARQDLERLQSAWIALSRA